MKTEEEKTQELWNKYFEVRENRKEKTDIEYQKDLTEAKNPLIVNYYSIVIKESEKMHKKIKEIQPDELASWGLEGLYQSIDKFDPSKGFKFCTYATHRIRGSILDNIRKADWVPRLARQKAAKADKVRQSLESSLGRRPLDQEIADMLKVSMEEFYTDAGHCGARVCTSMYASNKETDCDFDITDIACKEIDPLDGIIKVEFFEKILGKNFTKLERKIIYMHHYENYTMKEVAQQTRYSESRISQMHGQIMKRLRSKMEQNPKYMEEIEYVFSSMLP